MSDEGSRPLDTLREWAGFLGRQADAFKVNIQRNLAGNFAMSLTKQYQPIYMAALGASPLTLGYINSVSGLIYALISIPTGVVADRFGIRRVLLVTLSIYVVSALLFGVSASWELAAVAFILFSLAFTLDMTVCPMICGSMLQSHERVTGMGICDTISFFPNLVAPIVAAWIITASGGMNAQGIRPLYTLQILGFAASFIIVFARFKSPGASTGARGNPMGDVRKVFSEGRSVGRWILLTMLSMFPWQVMFYVPLFAAQVKGADPYIVGGMSTASTIVLVFLAVPLGHIADTYSRRRVIAAASLLVFLSHLMLIYAPSDAFLLLSGFFSGFTMTIGQTQVAIAADLVPREYLGSWYGVLGSFRGAVNVVSPILCGYVWDAVSPQAVFILLASVQLLHIGVLFSVPKSVTR